jgi:hypothetical protein
VTCSDLAPGQVRVRVQKEITLLIVRGLNMFTGPTASNEEILRGLSFELCVRGSYM